jgi:transposase InsO family protein
VNRKRVERMMREHRIIGRHLRRRCRTTIPDPSALPVPDLLKRNFRTGAAGARWCGDVTYLPVAGRWMYLAIVIEARAARHRRAG